eukprot:scaffold141352_cov130-Phaeocystis_antarctica.AAC.2
MYAQPSRIVADRKWTMHAAGPSLDSLLVRPELTLSRQTTNLKPATLVCSTPASAASLIPRNRPSYPFRFEQAGRLRLKRQLVPPLPPHGVRAPRRMCNVCTLDRAHSCKCNVVQSPEPPICARH